MAMGCAIPTQSRWMGLRFDRAGCRLGAVRQQPRAQRQERSDHRSGQRCPSTSAEPRRISGRGQILAAFKQRDTMGNIVSPYQLAAASEERWRDAFRPVALQTAINANLNVADAIGPLSPCQLNLPVRSAEAILAGSLGHETPEDATELGSFCRQCAASGDVPRVCPLVRTATRLAPPVHQLS